MSVRMGTFAPVPPGVANRSIGRWVREDDTVTLTVELSGVPDGDYPLAEVPFVDLTTTKPPILQVRDGQLLVNGFRYQVDPEPPRAKPAEVAEVAESVDPDPPAELSVNERLLAAERRLAAIEARLTTP